jgi:WD40 repeat protein
VDIYNWKTGNLISTIKYEALVNYGFRSIAFSDDGMLVALGGFNSIILNRSVGRLVVDLYGGDVFAFSSDGKYVLRGYGNGVAINSVFNSSDSCTFALKEGTEVSSAAFSHDNTMVAVGFKTGETEIWKIK